MKRSPIAPQTIRSRYFRKNSARTAICPTAAMPRARKGSHADHGWTAHCSLKNEPVLCRHQHPAEDPKSHQGILSEPCRVREQQDHADHVVLQEWINRDRLLRKKKLGVGIDSARLPIRTIRKTNRKAKKRQDDTGKELQRLRARDDGIMSPSPALRSQIQGRVRGTVWVHCAVFDHGLDVRNLKSAFCAVRAG